MNIMQITDFFERHHIGELFGIVSASLMAAVSYIPIMGEHNVQQVAVVGYFLVVFFLRLLLFIWNTALVKPGNETRSQAYMMLFSAIVILLTHSTVLTAVVYQTLVDRETPVVARFLGLAIVYGVYAITKIVASVYMMFRRNVRNLYTEVLTNIGWISALYTLTLFAHYLLIVQKETEFVWVRYLLIAVMGLVAAILGLIMLVKSIRTLRRYPKNV